MLSASRCTRRQSKHEQGDYGRLAVHIGRDPRPHYPIGAETCSCTITHLPFSFSQITVQRKFPNSTFPAFVVISSLTVAVPHTKASMLVHGGVIIDGELCALVAGEDIFYAGLILVPAAIFQRGDIKKCVPA